MRTRLFGFLVLAFLLVCAVRGTQLLSQPPGVASQRGDRNAGPGGAPGGFQPPAPPVLAALDANADGEITADELENAVPALQKLDKNSDGQLATDELMPVMGGFGGRGGGPGGPMHQQRMEVLKKFDQDKDGILNAEERAEARKYVKENQPARGFGGPGGPRGGGPGGPGGGPGFGPPAAVRVSVARVSVAQVRRVRPDRPRVTRVPACRPVVVSDPVLDRLGMVWALAIPASMIWGLVLPVPPETLWIPTWIFRVAWVARVGTSVAAVVRSGVVPAEADLLAGTVRNRRHPGSRWLPRT
ncbi:MAG: EF-hand domain-containing protein [Pirellulaceae bacterium]